MEECGYTSYLILACIRQPLWSWGQGPRQSMLGTRHCLSVWPMGTRAPGSRGPVTALPWTTVPTAQWLSMRRRCGWEATGFSGLSLRCAVWSHRWTDPTIPVWLKTRTEQALPSSLSQCQVSCLHWTVTFQAANNWRLIKTMYWCITPSINPPIQIPIRHHDGYIRHRP